MAIVIRQMGADGTEINEPINRTQKVILRNMNFQRELKKQRRLRFLLRSYRRQSLPQEELNQPLNTQSSASFSTKWAESGHSPLQRTVRAAERRTDIRSGIEAGILLHHRMAAWSPECLMLQFVQTTATH